MQRRLLTRQLPRCLIALPLLLVAPAMPAAPPEGRPAQGAPPAVTERGPAQSPGRERLRERFQQLPPQQQQRLKELAREFKALPEADQQRLRRCWEDAQRGAEVDCRKLLP